MKKKILIRIFPVAGPLPDTPHLAKSLKASFSNCYLTLFNERGCLSFLHTLRNKADIEEMKIMKNFIRKNDYVRNKDRQDPIAVLKLSDENVIKHMKEIGFVVHTLVPESTKFIQTNEIGMFPGPLRLSLGPYGFLFMLTYDSTTQTSKIFIKLHNSIEKI